MEKIEVVEWLQLTKRNAQQVYLTTDYAALPWLIVALAISIDVGK